MRGNGPNATWPGPVITFIEARLPIHQETGCWDHFCESIYEYACDALIALGQADEAPIGAMPRKVPSLPEILPRWDDICNVVVGLADQNLDIDCRLPDGRRPRSHGSKQPSKSTRDVQLEKANVLAAHGLGAAYVNPTLMPALEALGLIDQGRWTAAAEMVAWRHSGGPWLKVIMADKRFLAAVDHAVDSLPPDIRDEIDNVVLIPDSYVEAMLPKHIARHLEQRQKRGPNAGYDGPVPDFEEVKQRLKTGMRYRLEYLFSRRWRMGDGWLSPAEAERTLYNPYDILSGNMLVAVVKKLYPHLDWRRW